MNFTPFPNLTTDRLILRQLKITDENEIFTLRSDESVNKYINRPKANSIEDARNFIEKISNAVSNNESIFWVIASKDDLKFYGTICLWNISLEDFRAEIGYELLPEFQGKGIMNEAFTKVVEYGFQTMNLETILAFTNERNESSRKLLEKNNFVIDPGFEYLKTDTEKVNGALIYSLINPK